jgi:hypothetical protein
VLSLNPRIIADGKIAEMKRDSGLVAWVRSSSHEPGDGASKISGGDWSGVPDDADECGGDDLGTDAAGGD